MKYNVKPSASVTSPVRLSHTHQTTMDFGQILPIHSLECLARDTHNVNISNIVRLAPLVFPTYGRFSLRYASFFVPFYQICDQFEKFQTNTKQFGGQNMILPTFTARDLLAFFFTDSSYAQLTNYPSVPTDAQLADQDGYYPFGYTAGDGSRYRSFRLNQKGRYLLKVLQMLGYDLIMVNSATPSSGDTLGNPSFNALAILSYIKAYNDWMSLSAIYASSNITTFLEDVKHDPSKFNLSTALTIILQMKPLIGEDYFTSAYDSMNEPFVRNSDVVPDVMQKGLIDNLLDNIDLTQTKSDNIIQVPVKTKSVGGAQKTYAEISARNLSLLRSFDYFVRKNNLAGTRPAQRVYAMFGIETDDLRSNYAHIIDTARIPFEVGDVTSHTAGSEPGTTLGSYAGQSVGSGNFGFQYQCGDFGQLITFVFIDVQASYKNRVEMSVMRTSPLDFYQPDFDGVGMQPIPVCQLQNGRKSLNPSLSIFGFVPRYQDYRQAVDKVTGDFTLLSSLDAWHFARDINIQPSSGNIITPQSYAFSGVSDEFDRIFQFDNSTNEDPLGNYDHFYAAFDIQVDSQRPIKSLAGSIGFDDGDLPIDALGKTINGL